MNLIRKPVPALSLAVCTAVLWFAWRMASIERTAELLAVRSPAVRSPAASPADPSIRVAVLPEPAASLTLEVSGPFRIRPVGRDRVLHEGPRLPRTTVSVTSRGLRIGKREFPATQLEIVPSKSPAVWIDAHQYRGTMRLLRQPGGAVLAVNVLPLEEYVASVTDSEMPADFPHEARKAQAILARTFAVYRMRQAGPSAVLDLYASTRSQKYLGFQYRDDRGRLLAGESESGRRVTAETRGQVCTDRGEVFCTYYCAVCGGETVPGTDVFSDAAPPLQRVKCDWCRDSRHYRWTARVAKRDVQSDLAPVLRRDGVVLGNLKTVSVAQSAGGTGLRAYEVRGDRRTVKVSGADLRQALSRRGIFSPRFSVEDSGDSLTIRGRGHGHGVGLCQWGARGLALTGKNCDQILSHYYRGIRITTIGSRSAGESP